MGQQEIIIDLKKELEQTLTKPNPNYGRILELASQLTLFDPDYIRFTVDAGLISRLGRELVQKQETAVSELIKNAYDADATRVDLTFSDCSTPGGSLIISDSGHGMTREQLVNGFMRLSSTEKIHNPFSPQYQRTRAGKKGIGRFAAQRLGKDLLIRTQTEDTQKQLIVEIDWSKYKGDQELIYIENQIKEDRKIIDHGTSLTISNLTESWSIPQIERVYRYLVDLVQPFPLIKVKGKKIIDPGFDVHIYYYDGESEQEVASIDKLVYEYALAEIEGIVDDKGTGFWSINSDQLDIQEQALEIGKLLDNPKSQFDQLRNINFKAYYYIYNSPKSNYLPKPQNIYLRDLAKERGGIRIYRNGFRVLPYGEPFDDWLKLEEASARRRILPPFRRENFFGFVELIDIGTQVFEETSSREGLIETNAFRELVNFVSRVLESAVLLIAEKRERKQRPTGSVDTQPIARLRQSITKVKNVANNFTQRVKEAQISDVHEKKLHIEELHGLTQELQLVVNTLINTFEEEEIKEAQLIEEISMLRILASLGLSIGEFTHEVKLSLTSIRSDIKNIQDTEILSEVYAFAARLEKNVEHFRTYSAYFDRATSENVHREMSPQEMGLVLRTFWQIVSSAARRYGIEMPEPLISGYNLFTVPMHPSEWSSILLNLFTNSVKAIRRANSEGRILLMARKEDGRIYVGFADNGDGIATENKERIFNAFYTTSAPSSLSNSNRDYEELLGTGMGLKIIRDIINSYNGEIILINPPEGYVTCFQINVPAISDKELEQYGY